jgi:F0F1-type ATP synthase assembly protein I
MAVATFIGWGIGYWLDLQLGTYPWLMLLFLLVGLGAAAKGVFRSVREAQEIMGDRPPAGDKPPATSDTSGATPDTGTESNS